MSDHRFTLYDYILSGNCYKIRLFASLIGMPYQAIAVDFYPGFEHRSEAMLALNPAGTLPVMVTGSDAGDGTEEDKDYARRRESSPAFSCVFTETNAMLAWMALHADTDGEGWFPAADPVLGPQVQQGLAFGAGLTETLGLARLHTMLDWNTDGPRALRAAKADLRTLEAHLTERQIDGGLWWAGERPTIADIACFPYVALSPDAGLEHDGFPAIRRWLYAVRSLSGFVTMPGIHALHELR